MVKPVNITPLFSVRGLTVSLPEGMDRQYAVDNLSFDLRSGEILCIIGESGSGKSVTAHAAMGLLPKALHIKNGEILLRGNDLLTQSPVQMRELQGKVISIVFQDPLSALNPLMTIGEQIAEVMLAHKVGDEKSRQVKVLSLLQEVGLSNPDKIQFQYPFRLSGGQRQRVMIAMALALDPDILIADEPTTALDVTTQAQILKLISQLQQRKSMSVMFITHDFGVVEEIADSVIVMEKGVMVESGPVDEVLKNPKHPYSKKLIAAVPRLNTNEKNQRKSSPVLQVKNLIKTYRSNSGWFSRSNQIVAVNNISFTLFKGETLGIVGESGSGKSSLGRILSKLLDADGGEIIFKEKNILSLNEKDFRSYRSQIQMIFQDPFASLNPRHTIGTILSAGPLALKSLSTQEVERKAKDLLEQVGLDVSAWNRFPHEFSGGQRQRIGIARALMFDPEVLIADESVSALDVSIQAQVLELLKTIQEKTHVAMIFITHDLRVASQICDRISVLYKGEIVEDGTPQSVFHKPKHQYTQQLVRAIPGTVEEQYHR